ncbi:MAG: hypothetical protein R3E42_06580 [Burkholderiaceae bacterium]
MNHVSDLAALRWRAVSFETLSTTDLYRLLQLRSAVFVVEQACVFQDMDGLDFAALHLLGEVAGVGGRASGFGPMPGFCPLALPSQKPASGAW